MHIINTKKHSLKKSKKISSVIINSLVTFVVTVLLAGELYSEDETAETVTLYVVPGTVLEKSA